MMNEIKQFRASTPVITREAEDRARAALLLAMREPAPAPVRPRGRRMPRLAWRLVLAATAAVALVGGLNVVGGDDRPATVAVADVQELGERAAKTAAADPYSGYKVTPSAGQWLYVKETIAPLLDEPRPEVDRDRRMDLETWHSLDGRQTALDDGKGKLVVHEVGPGITGADLAKSPVTPEESLSRIRAVIDGTPAGPFEEGASRQQRVFLAISQLMSEQALTPEVRAALFRALPMIEGVTVKQDAVDAAGRHGVAFAYTGEWQRSEIIVSSEDYRFLGTYGEAVADRTFPSEKVGTVRAGTPLGWSAQLETRVVDRPGERP
ncbi:CU044_5270 family protein [Nonomuraea dietziae]|uniref:CU044_5270 family protein n=1 Tax=Nonomuraea dietziae TaxID=65515 RepID=UPI0033DCB82C